MHIWQDPGCSQAPADNETAGIDVRMMVCKSLMSQDAGVGLKMSVWDVGENFAMSEISLQTGCHYK